MEIKIKDLAVIRKKYRDKKIVYCVGVFDLIHVGHVLFLEQCKSLGDILVVMVLNDYNVRIYKGAERPICNENMRLAMIDALKPVDYCFLDNNYAGKVDPAPLEILKSLQPDIYGVNEETYALEEKRRIAEMLKIEFRVLKRSTPKKFGDPSSTSLIQRIKSLSSALLKKSLG